MKRFHQSVRLTRRLRLNQATRAIRNQVLGTMIGVMALTCAAQRAEAGVMVGGIMFDSNAFADTVISASFQPSDLGGGAATIEEAVLGSNLVTYFNPNNSADFVEVGFTDNLITNGPGDDLAIFELLSASDTISLSLVVGGMLYEVPTTDTGLTNGNGSQLNVGFFDLTTAGIAPGASIDRVVATGDGLPEIAAFGALNSAVPEPTSLAVWAFCSVGCCFGRRRRAS